MTEQHPFKWRHFQADILLLCVRWYLRYTLSSRDLEEMMLERGMHVDHTTIYRKGQMRGVKKGDISGQVACIARLFGVAA